MPRKKRSKSIKGEVDEVLKPSEKIKITKEEIDASVFHILNKKPWYTRATEAELERFLGTAFLHDGNICFNLKMKQELQEKYETEEEKSEREKSILYESEDKSQPMMFHKLLKDSQEPK